ncbi:MAG: hypothetical protein JSV22_06105 [Bacteroidales bacterium]|nr:MAG: hypothetical protein JSV22_06105 [Bacteroidales bacterium]
MKSTIKFLSLSSWIALITLVLINYSCNKDDDNGGLEGDTIGGIILAPDGSTPIAGATVYVPQSVKSSTKLNSDLFAVDCSEPDEAYIAYTCTDYDGSFELNISQVSQSSFTLRIAKGSFIKDYIIDLNTSDNNLGNLTLPSDPSEGAGNFALVTGSYDRMEDILAKLGMGEINSDYQLIPGTEKFDIYDGAYSFDFDYPLFEVIFTIDPSTGNPLIDNYDMVFINCGNSYEYEILADADKISILRQYVNDGGKLYITDLSYDFVEQVFPEYIDFYGSDEVTDTEAEEMDVAQIGDYSITSNATINDNQLLSWLKTVACQGGSCLNSDNTVHIAGFLSGWALINGAHPAKSSDVKIWITGPVSWYDWYLEDGEGSGSKPLTVSFNFGLGKVLYTSYHTEEENPSSGFWPQERILQYLVFEL